MSKEKSSLHGMAGSSEKLNTGGKNGTVRGKSGAGRKCEQKVNGRQEMASYGGRKKPSEGKKHVSTRIHGHLFVFVLLLFGFEVLLLLLFCVLFCGLFFLSFFETGSLYTVLAVLELTV